MELREELEKACRVEGMQRKKRMEYPRDGLAVRSIPRVNFFVCCGSGTRRSRGKCNRTLRWEVGGVEKNLFGPF